MENALITDKYDMATTLDKVGLTDGSFLTLVQGQPNRNRRREVVVDSPAFSNLAQVRTLFRNVRACYLQAQRDQGPIYDYSEEFESSPSRPSKFDNVLWSKSLMNPMAHGQRSLSYRNSYFNFSGGESRRRSQSIIYPVFEFFTYTC